MKHLRLAGIYSGMHVSEFTFVAFLSISAGILQAQTAIGPGKPEAESHGTKVPSNGAVLIAATQSASTDLIDPKFSGLLITANTDLPDAPGESSSAALPPRPMESPFAANEASVKAPPIAPLYHKYIEPGQTAQPLASADKVLFGAHQLISPYLLLTVTAAAAYEQALDGSPNYGTNISAYGQRVGAAAIRDASQVIFSDSIMAPLLHEDPRYYIMGDRRNGIVRAAYAVSRILVTRSDDGAPTPNYSLFAGYAGAAALENAYYPSDNHGARETAKSFAGSLGGAAVSNMVREFLPDIFRFAHIEKTN